VGAGKAEVVLQVRLRKGGNGRGGEGWGGKGVVSKWRSGLKKRRVKELGPAI